MSDSLKYRIANPWILVNVQNASAYSGRYPTRKAAEDAAKARGGVAEVSADSRTVYFSEMPSL